MTGPHYTKQEINLIRVNYPKIGPKKTQARLKKAGYTRSINSIKRKANQLGINVGLPKGYVSLTEVVHMAQGSWHYKLFTILRRYAEEDGVLFHTSVGRDRWSVPLDWAYEWLDNLDERRLLEEDEEWINTDELCDILGWSRNQVLKARRGESTPYINSAYRRIDRQRGLRLKWMYKRSDVNIIELEQRRARAA